MLGTVPRTHQGIDLIAEIPTDVAEAEGRHGLGDRRPLLDLAL